MRLLLFTILCLQLSAGVVHASGKEENCADDVTELAKQAPPPSALDQLGDVVATNPIKKNPFIEAGIDADEIGTVYKELKERSPDYKTLFDLSHKKGDLTPAEWKEYDHAVKNILEKAKHTPKSDPSWFDLREAFNLATKVDANRPLPEDQRQHIADKEPKQKDKDKKEEKEEEEKEDDNPWNKPQKEYEAHNKRLESGKGKKPVEIMRTDALTDEGLYEQVIYDVSTPHKDVALPTIREEYHVSTAPQDLKRQIVKFHNEPEIALPVTEGYEPISVGAGARLRRSKEGIWWVAGSGSAEVTMGKITGIKKAPDLAKYLEPDGIDPAEWPQDIQEFLHLTKGMHQGNPEAMNAHMQEFVQTRYKYYSEGDDVTKADLDKADQIASERKNSCNIIKMAFSKMLNCDGASKTGVNWLRRMGIPARLVAGRTRSYRETVNGVEYDVLDSAGPPHMWIQYWNGREWKQTDWQPPHENSNDKKDPSKKNPKKDDKKKDSKDKKENKDQKDHKEKSDKEKSEEEKGEEKKEGEEKSEEEKEGKEGEEGEQEDGKKDGKDAKHEEGDGKYQPDKRTEELIEELKNEYNPIFALLERATKTIMHEGSLLSGYTAPHQAMSDSLAAEDPTNASAKIRRSLARKITEYSDNTLAIRQSHDPIGHRINEMRALAVKEPGAELSQLILQMKAEFRELAEYRALTPEEQGFERALYQIESLVNAQAGKEGLARAQAKKVIDGLPGVVSLEVLHNELGGDPLTSNAAASRFNQLDKGSHFEFYRSLPVAAKYVDFLLQGGQEPIYEMVPTLDKSPVPTNQEEVLTANRLNNITKFIWDPKPGEHKLAPFFRNEQLAIGSYEEMPIIRKKSPLERKITYVLVDMTGSMSGVANAMTRLFAAFSDKSLSERDAMKLPLHTLVIVPFGADVLRDQVVVLESKKDAFNYIARLRNAPLVTNETSTGIGKAIEWTLGSMKEQVEDRKRSAMFRRPLKKANVVLFTDGADNVGYSLPGLVSQVKNMPKGLQQNWVMVEIGGANAHLTNINAAFNEALDNRTPEQKAKNSPPMKLHSRKIPIDGEAVRKIDNPPVEEATELGTVLAGPLNEETRDKILSLSVPNGPLTESRDYDWQRLLSKAGSPDTLTSEQRKYGKTLIDIADFIVGWNGLQSHQRKYIGSQIVNLYPFLTQRPLENLSKPEVRALQKIHDWSR